MTSETRISELTDIFKELADTAGGYERTRIMPNLEVIDASPSNLPANFIIIKDDEGFYIPALKVAGMTYTNGDLVNVLFIKGAEPIAFQHGSSGSGGYAIHVSDEGVDQGDASTLDFVGAGVTAAVAAGVATITVSAGGGWPFANVLTVSSTDPDADYPDIPSAITASAAGDIILVDAETFTPTDTILINKAITLMGLDPYGSGINFTENNKPAIKITAAGGKILNLSITHAGGGTTAAGVELAANGAVIENCSVVANAAPNNSFAIFQSAGTQAEIRNCQCYESGGVILARAFYNASGASATIFGGIFSGGIENVSGATLTLTDRPQIIVGTLTNAGTLTGEYTDPYNRVVRQKPIGINNVRLTLSSGTPVTTADVTAATTIYAALYKGNTIEVFNGAGWVEAPFTELSLSLSGFTADKNSDLWVYDNAGTLALERTEWTNDTTRATALAVQDGRYVKSGSTTRLYLGTFRTTGTTGQCEDSLTKRYVWNYYNRVSRKLRKYDNTSHTYNTATWRPFNNSATSAQVSFVIGVVEDAIPASVGETIAWVAGDSLAYVGMGLNSTSSPATINSAYGLSGALLVWTHGEHVPQAGYNYICPLEYATATGTAPTWYESEMLAEVKC